jgi:hypothetical protein
MMSKSKKSIRQMSSLTFDQKPCDQKGWVDLFTSLYWPPLFKYVMTTSNLSYFSVICFVDAAERRLTPWIN